MGDFSKPWLVWPIGGGGVPGGILDCESGLKVLSLAPVEVAGDGLRGRKSTLSGMYSPRGRGDGGALSCQPDRGAVA